MKIELSDDEADKLIALLEEILDEVTTWGEGTVLGFECYTTAEQINVAKRLYRRVLTEKRKPLKGSNFATRDKID